MDGNETGPINHRSNSIELNSGINGFSLQCGGVKILVLILETADSIFMKLHMREPRVTSSQHTKMELLCDVWGFSRDIVKLQQFFNRFSYQLFLISFFHSHAYSQSHAPDQGIGPYAVSIDAF